jgi:hypothetical protein
MIRIATPALEASRSGWSLFGSLLIWATRRAR